MKAEKEALHASYCGIYYNCGHFVGALFGGLTRRKEEAVMAEKLTIGGKYTIINDSGVVSVLRYGKEWHNGDKFILAMFNEIQRLRQGIDSALFDFQGAENPVTISIADELRKVLYGDEI